MDGGEWTGKGRNVWGVVKEGERGTSGGRNKGALRKGKYEAKHTGRGDEEWERAESM